MGTLFEEINPVYYKYFIYIDTRGNKSMHAESKKDIYGTLECDNFCVCFADIFDNK